MQKTLSTVLVTEPFSKEPLESIELCALTPPLNPNLVLNAISYGNFPFWAYIELMQKGVSEEDIVKNYVPALSGLAGRKLIGMEKLTIGRTLKDEIRELAAMPAVSGAETNIPKPARAEALDPTDIKAYCG